MIFAPKTRYRTIRSLVSFATSMGWNIHKMDVKNAFLIGIIDEKYIYRENLGI